MPTPDHLQNPDTPEIIITRDDDKIADILARQSYKSEDNPHVGYSQTISDGGVRGKEHLIRNIFYDDKPVGFATATLSTGEGNLFALLADNAYQESFLLDVPVSSYDRAADAWEGIGDKELDGYYCPAGQRGHGHQGGPDKAVGQRPQRGHGYQHAR